MSVLVQQVVSADYAFVIHTTNPSSGERSEIYAEVVKGLGETLVGAYPGRAMSFVCRKDNLESPKVNNTSSNYHLSPIVLKEKVLYIHKFIVLLLYIHKFIVLL
jgi:phosphoenolpyruvate synthase/pyruvate phosphate dikinase